MFIHFPFENDERLKSFRFWCIVGSTDYRKTDAGRKSLCLDVNLAEKYANSPLTRSIDERNVTRIFKKLEVRI